MRVQGHKLMARGAPHTAHSCQTWPCDSIAGVRRVNRQGTALASDADIRLAGYGHALCECGWTSAHLMSGAERRRAHAEHKWAKRRQSRVSAA